MRLVTMMASLSTRGRQAATHVGTATRGREAGRPRGPCRSCRRRAGLCGINDFSILLLGTAQVNIPGLSTL